MKINGIGIGFIGNLLAGGGAPVSREFELAKTGQVRVLGSGKTAPAPGGP